MIKIKDHLEVYVDCDGRVCLAKPSMDERCEVALEPDEVKTLIGWLTTALAESVGMKDEQSRTVATT